MPSAQQNPRANAAGIRNAFMRENNNKPHKPNQPAAGSSGCSWRKTTPQAKERMTAVI